jgi:uncharacterized protein YndB with AHSA1/START domain
VIGAPVEEVWRLASDPAYLAAWWPATERTEGSSRTGWTSVTTSPRGRAVRADYSLVTTEPPTRGRWRQEVEGTPFGRLFDSLEYELRLEPVAEGGEGPRGRRSAGVTRASVVLEQRPRGWARLGGLQIKRAAGRALDRALADLAGLAEHEDPA